MKRKKKKIYLGSLVIAIIVGIYIINANSKGIISKIIVKNNAVTTTGTEEVSLEFESENFLPIEFSNMIYDISYRVRSEKDPNKAKVIEEETLKQLVNEDKYQFYYVLAESAFNSFDFENSINFIDKAITYNPECYICYNLRGITNMSLKNREEALKDYTKGLNIKEEAILYHNRAAILKLKPKSYEKAITDLKAAIRLDESYNRAKFSLFNIYCKNKNISEAKNTLKLIKETLDPQFRENYAILLMHEAIILMLEDNLNDSIKLMEKVLIFMENLEKDLTDPFQTELISTYHFEIIFTKINIIINNLLQLKKYDYVLKYVNFAEKLNEKYYSFTLAKDIFMYKEKLKNINKN